MFKGFLRPRPRILAWAALAVAALCGPGCSAGSTPSAGVGDPGVYRPMDVNLAGDEAGGNLSDHLRRYFMSVASDGDGRRVKLDALLESHQAAHAVAQAAQAKLLLEVVAEPIVSKASATGQAAETAVSDTSEDANDAPATTATAPVPADEAQRLREFVDQAKDFVPADSAFDVLDRATDWYTAYIIKHLRRVPDSRSIRVAEEDLDADIKDGDRRLLWLVLQAQVHPGSRPDHMTGVRVKILRAEALDCTGEVAKTYPASAVQVTRLHPTRSYDVEESAFSESLASYLQLRAAAKAAISGVKVDAKAAADLAQQSEARRRFLTRVNKSVSFADADEHTFGWNFYPSNLTISQRPWFVRLLGQPKYRVDAHLEGGARDCLVALVVPADVNRVVCRSYSVSAAIDRDDLANNDPERTRASRYGPERSGHRGAKVADDDAGDGWFVIDLPVLHKDERDARRQSQTPLTDASKTPDVRDRPLNVFGLTLPAWSWPATRPGDESYEFEVGPEGP